ncbi:MAG: hypothetical protein ABSG28_08025 [Methanoregula sp.]|jgi:hypothetical protein|uniref:hypothetical protein n=1 Tax=Methanoregula sp. TaxID=2052170 RepID=UPI003C1799B1
MPESERDKTPAIFDVIEPRKKTAPRLIKPDPEHNAGAALKNAAVKELNGSMMHGKDALVSAGQIPVQMETRV